MWKTKRKLDIGERQGNKERKGEKKEREKVERKRMITVERKPAT